MEAPSKELLIRRMETFIKMMLVCVIENTYLETWAFLFFSNGYITAKSYTFARITYKGKKKENMPKCERI